MRKACGRLQTEAMTCVPAPLQDGLMLDVKDVQCGDPSCGGPVDTVFTLVWADGFRGIFSLPFSPDELEEDELQDYFPDEETLSQWKAGIKAVWPPKPPLRFAIGDPVECRVGPHPVKGWAAGRIIRLNYSQPGWPPNMVAPYQVALKDGRLIFAPQDSELVVRLRAPAGPDDPPSPPYPGEEEEMELGDEEKDT